MRRFIFLFLLTTVLLLIPNSTLAQTYKFNLDQEVVHVYWNKDGTVSIDYVFVITNDLSASPIDYVDVGFPNPNFQSNSVTAYMNGSEINDISREGYQGSGFGVAVGLGSNAVQPGQTGNIHVHAGTIHRVLYPDSTDSQYTSAVFSPTYFDSKFVIGITDITVIYHLPPGVQPDEPRWHKAPPGFPSQPQTGLDIEGRLTYTWRNSQANGHTQYIFGASFPRKYVPSSAILTPEKNEKPSLRETLGIESGAFCFWSVTIVVALISIVNWYRSSKRRKLQYLPPKIAIEGYGIKRGLTAVEAAVLLEQPMDKILTLILFAVIKKGVAAVETIDPFKLYITDPLPKGLKAYEINFLEASQKHQSLRRAALQETMVNLVRSVSLKMKGFSREETVEYYRDIVHRAWAQVEAADTPEVKSQMYDENLEWTMIDRNYAERTQDEFRSEPVYVPIWWGRFDPTFRPSTVSEFPKRSISRPTESSDVSMPTLPGSAFAATVITGVQDFSSNVVGNLTDFTSKITSETNPIPVSVSAGSGGGGCACACACAGCACACAGGGR